MLTYVVNRQKLKSPTNPQNDFLTLAEYVKFARIAISRFTTSNVAYSMLHSEDAISWVAEAIMLNDWKYSGEGYSKLAVRIRAARWAILNFLAETRKEQYTIPLSQLNDWLFGSITGQEWIKFAKKEFQDKIEKIAADQYQTDCINKEEYELSEVFRTKFDKLIEEAELTPKQEQCIRLKFEEGKNEVEISELLHCSRQNINQLIFNGLYKIKCLYAA